MIDQRTTPYAALILRVANGLLFLAHGGLKVFAFGFDGTAKYFVSIGLPAAFAYVIIVLEVVGGLALIFGVYARAVAVLLAVELLGTIVVVHGANGWFFMNKGGGWEYPALWAVALLALAMIGDGPYAFRSTPVGAAKRA